MEIEIKTQLNKEVIEQPIVIETQENYTNYADVLKACKNKVKELEEERKSYTAPLDESKKRIMAKFKEVVDPLESYISKVSKAMSDWYVVEEKKRKELQAQLEKEAVEKADKTNPDVIVPVVESVKTTKSGYSTTTMIKSYTYEVEDLTKVPREYLMVDDKKVKAVIKTGIKVDGIKIIEEFKPSSR